MSPRHLSRRAVITGAAAATVVAALTKPAWADPPPHASTMDDVVSWINEHADALASTDPADSLDDLDRMRHIVGQACVVGLGESTHGSREQFRMKHRMARFLVERMGFRTVGFEHDFAHGVDIDRYVTTGHGDARQLVAGMSSPLWATEEIVALVEWMRSFNRGRRDKVRFLGTDVLVLRQSSFDAVTAHVETVAPHRLADLERHLGPLSLRGSYYEHFQWYAELSDSDKQQLIEHAAAVSDLLRDLPRKASGRQVEYALQHARTIAGWYEYYATESGYRPTRERFIADTIGWWRHLSGHDIAYWAANVHTCAAPKVDFSMPGDAAKGVFAGGHLRKRWGHGYVSIGTLFGEGAVNSGWAPPAPQPVAAPPSHLLDATLEAAGPADFLLDLHAPAPPVVRRWRDAPSTMRMIHPAYAEGDDAADHTMTVESLAEAFDAIVHIRISTPSRLLAAD